MRIGMVVTVSNDWYKNVLLGLSKGVKEVDYWTNGWLPSEKIDRLEVYYEGALLLAGNIIEVDEDVYKDTPDNVYRKYRNSLYTLGLEPKRSNYNKFQEMLDEAFRTSCKPQIGNIIFEVDGVSETIIKGFKSNGINFPNGINPLPQQSLNQTINKIAYK